jgi:hypothetical protein
MRKTDIWVTHSYGYFEIRFSKVFDLPCPPFLGLIITDSTGDNELDVELVNNDYTSTRIYYHANKNEFEVNVRHRWRDAITDDAIDCTIRNFTLAGWQRQDQNDIPALKEAMKRVINQ